MNTINNITKREKDKTMNKILDIKNQKSPNELFECNDIVQSKRHLDSPTRYIIVSKTETEAKCLNLQDMYKYNIPFEDLVFVYRAPSN